MTDRVPLPTLHALAAVARYFEVNERTVRRWIASGSLIAVRFGSRLRVLDEELQRFAREGTCPKKSETGSEGISSSATQSGERSISTGTTLPLDRRLVLQLARETASRPAARSPSTPSSPKSPRSPPTRN